MKSIKCSDLGPTCLFTAEGETNEEVKEKLWAHGKEIHGKMMEDMTKKEMRKMDKKIDKMLMAQ
ncbi:DUF1059 domain-containing protein [Candidatus Pacearchaeota archaeon]|nr:DUF1059 domain-containing protein [Candidatus Pacearchaeota archaeon]